MWLLYTLIRARGILSAQSQPELTEKEIREYVSGHICSCGTYKQMIEGILEHAKAQRHEEQISACSTEEAQERGTVQLKPLLT